MIDSVWQEIEGDLEELHTDVTLIRFHPLIIRIKQWASTKPPVYPPDIFRAFIELIRQMGTDVHHGQSVNMVLEQAATRSGTYNQPSWDVNNVYQTNGHIFQFILDKWRNEIEPEEPDSGIRLPIVLLVMSMLEAEELISGVAFQGHPKELLEDFNHLRQLLHMHGISDWQQNYKQKPCTWQPFKSSNQSIEQLMNHVLGRIEGYQKPIVPYFIDIHSLNEDHNRGLLQQLRHEGCVVILDIISMQHPSIQHEFRRSLLDVFPNTIVARIAPIAAALNIMQHMIIIIERHIEMEFYKRFQMDLGDRCQEISSLTDFARWLKNQAPKLLPDDFISQSNTRKYWYNKMNGNGI